MPVKDQSPIFRQPDMHGDQVAFICQDQLWLYKKNNRVAHPILPPRNFPAARYEASFPRFSPDGKFLAFNANFAGSQDVWLLELATEELSRLTSHPSEDRLAGWYPNSDAILFSSNRESSFPSQYRQLYRLKLESGSTGWQSGSLQRLALPYGEYGAISPDGEQLAFQIVETDRQLWSQYRGGMNPDIYLCKTAGLSTKPTNLRAIVRRRSNDSHPLWHDNSRLLFLSDWYTRDDPGLGQNLWSIDLAADPQEKGYWQQLTFYYDFGLRFPAAHALDKSTKIVFERYGSLYHCTFDGKYLSRPELVEIPFPNPAEIPQRERTCNFRFPSLSRQSIFFEGRGRIWQAFPRGPHQQLPQLASTARRYPSVSPTGEYLAYYSDEPGEYHLYVRNLQSGQERRIFFPSGFRYPVSWSPDERYLALVDEKHCLKILERESGEPESIDRIEGTSHPELERFAPAWLDRGAAAQQAPQQPGTIVMVYTRPVANRNHALFLYDLAWPDVVFQLTSGDFNDRLPCFQSETLIKKVEPEEDIDDRFKCPEDRIGSAEKPNGDTVKKDACEYIAITTHYLYFASRRNFSILIGEVGYGWVHANTQEIYCLPLAAIEAAIAKGASERAKSVPKKNQTKVIVPVFRELEPQVEATEISRGRFLKLAPAPEGGLLVHRNFNQGDVVRGTRKPLEHYRAPRSSGASRMLYPSIDRLVVGPDRNKVLVEVGQSFFILNALTWEEQIALVELPASQSLVVAKKEEWLQIWKDAWRLARDYFYVKPKLNGLFLYCWRRTRKKFEELNLPDRVRSRQELNLVLGWLYAELRTSHAEVTGGDLPPGPDMTMFGYLGANVEWVKESADATFRCRVAEILRGSPSDLSYYRSPLLEPLCGCEVKEGDFIVGVNRRKIQADSDLWPLLQQGAETEIELERPAGKSGKPAGAKNNFTILVVSLDRRREIELRLRAWVEANLRFVDRLTGGLVGYVDIPNTAGDGHVKFTRQFQAQYHKPGLIYDGRFIPGGVYPEPILDLISRPRTARFVSRNTELEPEAGLSRIGAQVLLINRWAGSGGDLLPYLFRLAGLGVLIGTRTWGGTVASKGVPDLIDGGRVTVPSMAFVDPKNAVYIENRGVKPDIKVPEKLGELAAGEDPQLEKAITRVLAELLDPTVPAPLGPLPTAFKKPSGLKISRNPASANQPIRSKRPRGNWVKRKIVVRRSSNRRVQRERIAILHRAYLELRDATSQEGKMAFAALNRCLDDVPCVLGQYRGDIAKAVEQIRAKAQESSTHGKSTDEPRSTSAESIDRANWPLYKLRR